MNMDHSAWEGIEIAGKVDTVLSRGTVVDRRHASTSARKGHGQYLQRGLSQYLDLTAEARSMEHDDKRIRRDWIDGGSRWIRRHVAAGTGAPVVGTRPPASSRPRSSFASVDEVDAAVAAAAAAFPAWRATSLSRRVGGDVPLPRAGRRQPQGDRVAILTTEHGKVLSDALGEVARGLENVEFACGIPHLLKGGFSEQASTGVDVYSIRQPLGVVAGITPFNFPAMVPMWMFANAIACGNTFVLKPREKDPSASLFLAELLQGRPACPTACSTSCRATRWPSTASSSTPTSPPSASSARRRSPATSTRPAPRTASGCRRSAGPRTTWSCCPTPTSTWPPTPPCRPATARPASAAWRSRSWSPSATSADPLVDAIQARLPKLTIGPGTEPDSEMGPLITREHRDKVASLPRQAPPTQGATVVVDGRDDRRADGDGFFLGVSLLDDVTPGHGRLHRRDLRPGAGGRARRHLRRGRRRSSTTTRTATAPRSSPATAAPPGSSSSTSTCGMVGVNVPIPVPVAYYSFGGWKASLFGDTHMYGPDGVHFYTRTKVVTSRWPDPATSHGRPRLPRRTALRSAGGMDFGVVLQTNPAGLARRRAGPPGRAARASATCGRSTPTSCGRSRSSSTARSWPATRKVIGRADGDQPGHPRLDRDGVAVRHAQRDVRQPHGLRHRPGRLGGAGHQRQAHDAGHAARGDPRHPRAGQRPRGRLQRAATLRFPWGRRQPPRGLGRRLRPQGARAHRRGRRRVHPAARRPGHHGVDDQGGAGGGRAAPAATRPSVKICVAAPAYVGDDLAHQRDQCRWFGGMVGNHVADIVARYGADGARAQGAHRLHQGPRRATTTTSTAGPATPTPPSCPTRSSIASACSGRRRPTSSGSRELKSLGVDQFAIYLQHDAKESTLAGLRRARHAGRRRPGDRPSRERRPREQSAEQAVGVHVPRSAVVAGLPGLGGLQVVGHGDRRQGLRPGSCRPAPTTPPCPTSGTSLQPLRRSRATGRPTRRSGVVGARGRLVHVPRGHGRLRHRRGRRASRWPS